MAANIVYWGIDPRYDFYLNFYTPQKIIHHKDYVDIGGSNFFKCPSFLNLYKCTYNLLSPIDYSIGWEDNRFYSTHYDQRFYDEQILERSPQHGLIGLAIIDYVFFTEQDSCILTYGDPYFSKQDFSSMANVMCGTFDIGKWFRPTNLSFFFKKKSLIHIKRGEPLSSVSFNFNNDNPVILKRFTVNDKIKKYIQHTVSAKKFGFSLDHLKPFNYFKTVYELMEASSTKKQILKEIKNNLL